MKNNPLASFWSPLWHYRGPKGYKEELKVLGEQQANKDYENL